MDIEVLALTRHRISAPDLYSWHTQDHPSKFWQHHDSRLAAHLEKMIVSKKKDGTLVWKKSGETIMQFRYTVCSKHKNYRYIEDRGWVRDDFKLSIGEDYIALCKAYAQQHGLLFLDVTEGEPIEKALTALLGVTV